MLRCPASKFATHCISHFLFLILLSAATFGLGEKYELHELDESADELAVRSWLESNFRPAKAIITHVQICIVVYIAGTQSDDVGKKFRDIFFITGKPSRTIRIYWSRK